jgi:ketosteroid isomerase-like protein
MSEDPTTPDPDLVEAIGQMMALSNRREFDAVLAEFHSPDAVWDMSTTGAGVSAGREAIRGFWEDWTTAYEDFTAEAEEFYDLGNGVGLSVFVQRGRLRDSVGLAELRNVLVTSFSDGLSERVMIYPDIDEARAAAERLAEERGS